MWHGYCEFLLDCAPRIHNPSNDQGDNHGLDQPEFIDWRFGFEITMYIANR
jgi:coenzyme PQQ precursor peptide PqqA